MPAYTISSNAPIAATQRKAIANTITQVHCKLTGAPPSFVSVFFSHGVSIRRDSSMFVFGNVRKGRDATTNQALSVALRAALSETHKVAEQSIDLELFEVPASWLMEHGRIVPEPGEEEAAGWLVPAHG